jgi:iron complex outermembrane receptor protein
MLHVQPIDAARFEFSYSYLDNSFSRDPGSTDLSGGSGEANDPAHQGFLGWSFDLAPGWELDGFVRAVGRLPNPPVPAYAAARVRLAWRATPHLELALIGSDLPQARHPEFGPAAIRDEFERRLYTRVVVRF